MTKKKPAEKATMKTLTASNLANTLWATLNDVKEGLIETPVANSVAAQSREICRVVRMQIDAEKSGVSRSKLLLK